MAKEEPESKAKKARIKYMGYSDERSILKGDTFGGRLPDGLNVDLVWNESNHWIAETELDPEVLDLLLTSQIERDGTGAFIPAFQDVTRMKVVPRGGFEERWRPQGLADAREASPMVGVTTSGLTPQVGSDSGAT